VSVTIGMDESGFLPYKKNLGKRTTTLDGMVSAHDLPLLLRMHL